MAYIYMSGVELLGVEMSGVELSGVEMWGVELSGVEMSNPQFQNVKLSKNQKRAWLFLYACQSEVVQSMFSEIRETIHFFWYPTSLV